MLSKAMSVIGRPMAWFFVITTLGAGCCAGCGAAGGAMATLAAEAVLR